jgi:hypothetical protein
MYYWHTVAACILLFVTAGVNVAQDRRSSKDGCVRIDPARAPQFITYDRKSESEIFLRLRNNSSCAIVVETDDQYPTQITKLPQKGVTIEPVLASRDGIRLQLHYLVQSKPQRELTRAYGWGDSVFVYEIPASQSITFSVPLNHFKRRYNIAVPFGYSWEGNNSIGTGIGGVVHLVYFLSDELAPDALR